MLETIEPWGEKRADYRAAVICLTIANCFGGSRGRRPQLKDFLKLFEFEKTEKSDDDFLKKIGG